jgi:mono/diheme cytochrome c family protein
MLASIGLAATLATGCEYSSPHRAISAAAMSASNDIVPPRWTQRLYESNCAVCHGIQGDGNGPAAGMFLTRPRDFLAGIFKFRSTPSGSLPTDEDLFWTITHGLRWTGMIARPDLSKAELQCSSPGKNVLSQVCC